MNFEFLKYSFKTLFILIIEDFGAPVYFVPEVSAHS